MSRRHSHSWKREEFHSYILLGERRDKTTCGHQQKQVESSPVTPPARGHDEPTTSASSTKTTYRIQYGPVSTSCWRPLHPITHITWSAGAGYKLRLVYSDAAGQIFVHDSTREVVSQLLIPTHLQPSHETSSSDSTISSPHSWMDIEERIEEVSGVDSVYERAFRAEMVKNGLRPFRSSQPILDLKVNMKYHWVTPVEVAEDAEGQICIQTIDLIHAHSITRLGYFTSDSRSSKVWCVPQVIHINTILTLPKSVTIASCEFFPGVPCGPTYEVGPLVFTRPGSSHIYMARPNSSRPPTILVHADNLKALMPPTTSIHGDLVEDSPPLLCRSERRRYHQKDGVPCYLSLLVMFNGYVFRVEFNPINLSMTEIELVIGSSPHHSPMTVAPFFRRNAQDYCLQEELNRNVFVLDRLEGSVSQFSITGELKQCIEPSPPPGLTYRTPFQGFLLHPVYSDIYLTDSFGAAIYLWTSNHDKQCHYDLDGYSSNPTLKFDRPRPLRPAITIPPTVLQSAIPLVFSTTEGWHVYTPPYSLAGLLKRARQMGQSLWWWWLDRWCKEMEACLEVDATWKSRTLFCLKFFAFWFGLPYVLGYVVMNVTGWGKQQSAKNG